MQILSKTSLAAALCAAFALTSAALPVQATESSTSTQQQTQGQLPDFVKLVEDNGAGVVNISVTKNARTVAVPNFGFPGMDEQGAEIFRRFGFPMPFGGGEQEIPEQRGTGSGFIISTDGLILTNAHVVEGADKIVVRLTDKREFEGKVLGTDKQTDIAVVKIEAKDLPALKMGDSNQLKVGEWVAAIGSPFGLDKTVTAGIVSALSRNLPTDQLFNMKGEVVGINSQIFSTSGGFMGLSFAIPIDIALQVKDQLVKDGKVTRGYVGVYIQQVTQDLAESFGLKTPEGALVTKIEKGSPAEKAGLKAGDVITALNDRKVTSSSSLPMLVSSLRPGTKAELTVIRDKKEIKLDITIGTNSAADNSASSADTHRLGIEARVLTDAESKDAETTGLLITKVSKFAQQSGLMAGDIIVSANGKLMKSASDLREACRSDQVLLLVQRDGGRIFIPVRFPKK